MINEGNLMDQNSSIIEKAITGSLNIIEQEREREIIARRFGLSGQKETLEQIGELLNITRERVRQLEKAILVRLRIGAEEAQILDLGPAEKLMIRNLTELGRVARTTALGEQIYGHKTTAAENAKLFFIASISSNLTAIDENDLYYPAIGIADYGDAFAIRDKVDEVVSVIKKNGSPMTIDQLDEVLDYEHPSYIKAIASISKQLASLNGLWGLTKWPTVNPRNIRDKIFVVLEAKKEPMHFSDIAEAISKSDFRRKNVTVQAIHNELIKDPRFVLIGRGIYALSTWGYARGTVADIITDILKKAGEPLTREEIVKRVLHARKVKETTVLLNLQNKDLFKKVERDSYTLAD